MKGPKEHWRKQQQTFGFQTEHLTLVIKQMEKGSDFRGPPWLRFVTLDTPSISVRWVKGKGAETGLVGRSALVSEHKGRAGNSEKVASYAAHCGPKDQLGTLQPKSLWPPLVLQQ